MFKLSHNDGSYVEDLHLSFLCTFDKYFHIIIFFNLLVLNLGSFFFIRNVLGVSGFCNL